MVDFDRHAEERYNAFESTGGPAHGGITVLDWFAGKALQVYLQASMGQLVDGQNIAANAYDIAEAMLKERAKRHAPKGAVQGVTGRSYG